MKVKYNLTEKRRKEMTKLLSKITGMPACITRLTLRPYIVGDYMITKDGILICDDRCNARLVMDLLEQEGFKADQIISE